MLPDQALLDTKMETSPDTFSRLMREHGEVFWWERGGFFIVTRYSLAEQVLRGPEYSADRSSFFISRMPNLDLRLIGDFFGVISKMMVMSDGAEHAARRKIAAAGLADDIMDQYEPFVGKLVERLVDEVADRGAFDFVRDVAEPLPSRVLADLFRIPEARRMDFYRWSHNMTQFFGGASQYRNEDGVEVNQSASNIRDHFRALITERMKNPGEDFLSVLIRHQAKLGLTEEEMVSQAAMMLVAGQITTTDQMANNLYQVLERPGALDRLQRNPQLVASAMEEFNRLDPAVTFLFRVAKQETRLGNLTIPEKGVVFISTHAVNRDPNVFERADECFLDRRHNPHLAYGHGPHFCLGARLARIQMKALFTHLLARFPSLRWEGEGAAVRKHHSLAFSGFERQSLSVRPPSVKKAPGRVLELGYA